MRTPRTNMSNISKRSVINKKDCIMCVLVYCVYERRCMYACVKEFAYGIIVMRSLIMHYGHQFCTTVISSALRSSAQSFNHQLCTSVIHFVLRSLILYYGHQYCTTVISFVIRPLFSTAVITFVLRCLFVYDGHQLCTTVINFVLLSWFLYYGH